MPMPEVKYHSGPKPAEVFTPPPWQDHAVLYVKVGASANLRPVALTEDQLLNIIEQAASALTELRKRNRDAR